MEIKLDFTKFCKKFPKLKECCLEQIELEKAKRDELFDRVVFKTSKVSEIDDVPTEDMLDMLKNLGTYFGEALPYEKERQRIAEQALKTDGIGHIRVL